MSTVENCWLDHKGLESISLVIDDPDPWEDEYLEYVCRRISETVELEELYVFYSARLRNIERAADEETRGPKMVGLGEKDLGHGVFPGDS